MKKIYSFSGTGNQKTFFGLPFIMVITILMSLSSIKALGTETAYTSPAWDGSKNVNICVGGTVTVYINDSELAHQYRLRQSGSPTWQTKYGNGGLLTFDVLTFSSTGTTTWTVEDRDGDGLPFETFNVVVVADPTASTMTKSPDLATVCNGQNVSASVNVPGSGGVSCSNTYFYRTNGGGWSSYNPGDPISTPSGTTSVDIKAVRGGCGGSGCDEATNTVSWTVNPQPSGPTGSTKTPNLDKVCDGTNVSATFTAGTGGVGCTDSYQYSTDGGFTWTPYSEGNTIGTTGITSVIIQGKRDGCTSGSGCTGTSWVTIYSWQVVNDFAMGTQPLGATICAGTTHEMTVSASGGVTPYIYQWQSGPTSTGPWTNIGTDSPSYTTVSSPNSATWYQCLINSATGAGCSVLASNAVLVTELPIFSPGNIANASQSICYNFNAATLSVSPSGATGSFSYQWYKKTTGIGTCSDNVGDWELISGANTASYTPANVQATTMYRCMIDPTGTPDCPAAWSNDCATVEVSALETVVYVDPAYNSGTTGWGCYAFDKIQDAINRLEVGEAGGTIYVAAGTYAEQLLIQKAVTIDGAGKTQTIITRQVKITAPDETDRVILKDLAIQYNNTTTSPNDVWALEVNAVGGDVAPITFDGISVKCTSSVSIVYGSGVILIPNGHYIDDVVVTGCSIDGSYTHGLTIKSTTVATAGGVTNLELINSSFDNNFTKGQQGFGWYVEKSNGGIVVDGVEVTNCTFNDNGLKGIYLEALSNAIFDNITIDHSGFWSTAGHNAGLDINLKYGTYSNITLNQSTINNCGTGDATNGAGVQIKARDDGSTYGANPASLTGVTLTNNFITNCQGGVRFGEPGKQNLTPRDILIEECKISGNTLYGIRNHVQPNPNQNITAINNNYGTTNGPANYKNVFNVGSQGNQVYCTNAPLDKIVFCPWIKGTGTDNDPITPGYQPVPTDMDYAPITNTEATVGKFSNFTDAIAGTPALGTIDAVDGLYVESNIPVNKSMTIEGQSQAGVVLAPAALNNPVDGSFPTGYQYAFLVGSSDITIKNLTIDGEANTALGSGHNYHGGVMTDHRLGILFNNITVQNVLVQHTYRRGIQIFSNIAGTNSTGHLVTGNTVKDVTVGPGIVIFDGHNTVSNNTIQDIPAGSGIEQVQWNGPGSVNTFIKGNVISNVLTGIQSVYASSTSMIGGPTPADGNTISLNGSDENIGIILRDAIGGATVQNNIVTGSNEDAGIWLYREGTSGNPVLIMDNTLTATTSSSGTDGFATGILATDDRSFVNGSTDNNPVYATISGNKIDGFQTGIRLHASGTEPVGLVSATIQNNQITGGAKGIVLYDFNGATSGYSAAAVINDNNLSNNSTYGVDATSLAGSSVNAECNWWGTAVGGSISSMVSGPVDYTSWLNSAGTNTNPGFTPTPGSCTGEAVVISSATTHNRLCSVDGSIDVYFNYISANGPYTINWTRTEGGFGSTGGYTSSPATITGLADGSYTLTATDNFGTTSASFGPVVVLYQPVTLKDGSLVVKGYHATIQAAINAATTGDVIDVCTGTYAENVIVDEQVTILGNGGTGTKPIVNGTSAAQVFQVTVPNVTMDNFEIEVTQGTPLYGIRTGNSGTFNNLKVEDCHIKGTGTTGSPVFGSMGIYLGSFGGAVNDQVTLINNTIEHSGTSPFGRAVRLYNYYGSITGNTFKGWYSIQAGDNGGGTILIDDNQLYGSTEINNLTNAGTFSNNDLFPSNAYGAGTDATQLELKNISNPSGSLLIQQNTFNNYLYYGIFAGRVNNVTVDENVFTPDPASTGYRSVCLNTKQRTTGAQSAFTSGITLINNDFKGNSAVGQTGIAFEVANYDNASAIGTVVVGTSGNENTFRGDNAQFIVLNNETGAAPTTGFWAGIYASTMTKVTASFDAGNNYYETSPPTLPSAMSLPQLYALEDKIQHKIDDSGLGFVTMIPNNDYVTVNSFVAPATTSPKIQRGINAAGTSGWTVNVAPGTYNEEFYIDRSLTLNGAKAGVDARTRTFTGESILDGTGLTGAPHDGIKITNGVSNVVIDGFEIRNYTGSGANGDGNAISSYCMSSNTTGASNVTVQNNYIHDNAYNGILVGSENVSGSSMVVQSGWLIQKNKLEKYTYAGIELTNVINSQVKDNDIAAPTVMFPDPGDAGVAIEIAARSRDKSVTAGTNVDVSGNTITGAFPTGSRAAINLLSRSYDYAEANASLAGVDIYGNSISGATNVRAAILAVAESRNSHPSSISTLAITGNILDGNKDGIEIQDYINGGSGPASHSGMTISGNEIKNSTGYGVDILTSTAATGIAVNNNAILSNALFGINNGGTGVLAATCNWWGTNDYTTIITKSQGKVSYVPYLQNSTIVPGPGYDCSGGPSVPVSLTVTHTSSIQEVFVQFGVTVGNLELYPMPGNPTDPAVIAARYYALAAALAGGDPGTIKNAALDIGDDVITEYYYMVGSTKVYLKTAGNNDLVKNKYWSEYLVRDDAVRFPFWGVSPRTLILKDHSYLTHTNPGTGAVSASWLDPVRGKTLYVTVTLIQNGNVTCTTQSVAIPLGPVNVYSASPPTPGLGGNWVSSHLKIQDAIDFGSTVNGYVVVADAGTYQEWITVNKSLDIRGPNYGVSPNTVVRGSEAIVIPPTTNTSTGYLFLITASDVSIDGFTVDGDNPALPSSGVGFGGSDDAYNGMYANSNGLTNVKVKNNIVTNLYGNGIRLQQATNFFATTTGATYSYDNIVDNNLVSNISVIGIRCQNSMYAAITNNVIENAYYGIYMYSMRIENKGSNRAISGNSVEAHEVGIWFNLYSASTYTVSDNIITAYNDVDVTDWYGIMLSTVSGAQNFMSQMNLPKVTPAEYHLFDNNTIDGSGRNVATNGFGLWLWYLDNFRDDVGVDHYTTFSGGSISNVDIGVLMKNVDSDPNTLFGNATVGTHASISGVSITVNSGGTGIYLKDDPTWVTGNPAPLIAKRDVKLAIGSGVSIDGGVKGLNMNYVVAAPYNALPTGIGNMAFLLQTGNYIELSNYTYNIDGTAAMFDGETGATATFAENFAIEDKIVHRIDDKALGFVLVKANNAYVTDIAAATPANNDYTRICNAVDYVANNWTINLDGTFDWTETNAAASWALGNDGVTGNDDDYTLLAPADLTGITFTAPEGLGHATIQGPGDLPGVNLEGTLNFWLGNNQNWTISNLELLDFDMAIGMFYVGTTDYNNTLITNNHIRIPKDLNATVAPGEVYQNIGIHYAFGTNQTISNNIFDVEGDGISDGTNYSFSIVMQSNTSGGAVYDGLKIKDNTITVTGVPDPISPAVIRGIWENGANSSSAIEISGNIFTNAETGNTADLNRQVAFWVTSVSDVSKKVEYKNNEVSGFNEGIAWIGGAYTSYTPPEYQTGQFPVEIKNNKFNGMKNAVVVRKAVTSTNPGSPALINDNSFTNAITGGLAIKNEGTGEANATCNWFGTTIPAAIDLLVDGDVDYTPWLTDDEDGSPAPGFQPTGNCDGTPVEITSGDPDHIICGETTGSINVSWTGGVANYVVDWGISSQTEVSGTSFNITGLAAGTYTITVTDTYGASDTYGPVEVLYLPVTNVTDDPDTYFATIQEAIDDASAGDEIDVCAETYAENVVIDKKLSLIGQGSGTIINPASGYALTLAAGSSGSGVADRTLIKDIRLTDAEVGVRFDPGTTFSYITLENLTIDNQTYAGINLRDNTTYNDILLLNISAENNLYGFRSHHSGLVASGLVIDGGSYSNNTNCGILTNGGTINNITIKNATFEGNAVGSTWCTGEGQIDLYGFHGNVTMQNLSIDATDADFGIQISGGYPIDGFPTLEPGGTMTFDNVSITGDVDNWGFILSRYSALGGFTMNDVVIDVDLSAGIPCYSTRRAAFSVDVVADDLPLDLGNILIDGARESGAQHPYDIRSLASVNIDALDATFHTYNETSLADNFSIEDMVYHALDYSASGLVRWKPAELFVTLESGSIQRGNDAADIGDIINVSAGTFNEIVTINKRITLDGAGNTADPGVSTIIIPAASPTSNATVLLLANGNSASERMVMKDVRILGDVTHHGMRIGQESGPNIMGGSFTTLENMVFTGATGAGARCNYTGEIEDLRILDCNFFGNSNGFRQSSLTRIKGLTILNTTASNNLGQGLYLQGELTGLNITGGSFNNNITTGGSGQNLIVQALNKNYSTPLSSSLSDFNANGSATGIQITYFGGQVDIDDVSVSGNTIRGLYLLTASGFPATGPFTVNNSTFSGHVSGAGEGIRLGGSVTAPLSGVTLQNNLIQGNLVGIYVSDYAGTGNIIENNSIQGNTAWNIQRPIPTNDGTLAATCNWWGTTDGDDIALKITGNVDYDPWLLDGTNEATGNGFYQSAPNCTGTALQIISAVPDHIICGESTGSILVTFSGGSPTYTISWGTGSASGISGSPYDITGLAAGTYNVVLTDIYGFSVNQSVTVKYLPVTNTTDDPDTYYATIQEAIDALTTADGDVIEVCTGTYLENVAVTKGVTINGAGELNTTVMPAVSAPNPSGCGESICTGASIVFLVKADGVTIQNLTVDGNNPSISSGVTSNSVDVDARNGIITDYRDDPTLYDNLEVNHVTVRNIYLRGIQNSRGTGFNFHDNHIINVAGEASSIAMFNSWGSGSFLNNHVDLSNDGIASNHSKGTTYAYNEVTHSSSGIHSDNNGSMGGTTDEIHHNSVSLGAGSAPYGIFVFAPYRSVSVHHNSIADVYVGLSSWGQQATVNPVFDNNTVEQSIFGVYTTTSLISWGSSNVSNLFTNNTIQNNSYGFYIDAETGFTNSTSVTTNNHILNNSEIGIYTSGTGCNATVNGNLTTINGNGIGIYLDGNSTASIEDNTISNNTDYGVYIAGGANLSSCSGNNITNNTNGGVFIASDAGTIGSITENAITGNGYGLDNQKTSVTVNAESNWWGAASGPTTSQNTPSTNPCGTGDKVSLYVDYSPWYYQSGMTSLNGLPVLTLSAVPDISTVTKTPVIITESVTYPDLTGYDPAVLTDALISTTTAFPAGCKVFRVVYQEGTGTPTTIPISPAYDLDGLSQVYLSDILGTAATPLVGHSNKVIHWKIYIEGATAPAMNAITIQSLAYTSKTGCISDLGSPVDFDATFDDATLALTDAPETVCIGGVSEFIFELTHPTIDPVTGEILSNATINSDVILPVGTKISWTYDWGGAQAPSGSLTLTTATSTLNLSEIVTGVQGNLISPNLFGHTGSLQWKFTAENLPVNTYNLTTFAAAQLPDGTLYPYAEMTPAIQLVVVADPVAPGLTKNPTDATVCAGKMLTASTTAGSGGTGTITDEYRYSTTNGASWSTWSTSVPNFAAVVGTNLIESRRTATGSGCNESSFNSISWNVVADPVAPGITKNPADANVCEGQILTASTTPGSGGTGTITDEYRYSTDNGANWSLWSTSVPNFAAVTGTNLIESRRTADGADCNTSPSNSISWNVVADPVAPGITKNPADANVCAGQMLTASTTPGSGGTGTITDEYRYSTDNGANWSLWSTSVPNFAAVIGTNLIESRRTADGADCNTSPSNSINWNVVADPVAPGITKNPADANVCAGQMLTASTTPGNGGTGTIVDEYRYSTDNGANWSLWSTSVPNFAAVVGTNLIESRRTADGADCNISPSNSISWNVVADPVAPGITMNPADANVCAGQMLTASTTPGSGGTGTIVDEYRYSTDNGANWSLWSTTVPNFAAVVGTNLIESRRTADGADCNTSPSNSINWNVVADPVAPGITKNPADANVCAGQMLTASTTPGSGGTGTIVDEYRYSTDNGANWSLWSTSVPNFAAVVGTNLIESRRTADGADCNTSPSNSISWNVVADPVAPGITKNPADANVCAGQMLTASTTPGSGGTGTIVDEYRYSTDNGANWSLWSTSVPNFAAVVGTNLIESRRTADGADCNTSSSNSISWNVVADPSWATNIVAPTTICYLQQVNLTATVTNGLGGTITWYRSTSPTGFPNVVVTTNPDTPPAAGTYYYFPGYTPSGLGCNLTDGTITTVLVNPLPTPAITPNLTPTTLVPVCAGSTGNVYATTNVPGHSYLWMVTGGVITSPQGFNTITVTWGLGASGTLTVTEYIGATMCSASDTKTIALNPLPTPVVSGAATAVINTTETYTVPLQAGHAYIWTISGGTPSSYPAPNQVTVLWGGTPGTGSVTVTDLNITTGCVGTSAPYSVTLTTGGYTISGYFRYHNSAGAGTPLDNLSLTLKQGLITKATTTTDSYGYYTFTGVPDGTYTIEATTLKIVDEVNGNDAGLVNAWWGATYGQYAIEHVRFNAGDVYGDNYINGSDASGILGFFVGQFTFPRGSWTFWKQPDVSITNPPTSDNNVVVAGANKVQDFFGLCVGDFSRSYTPLPGKSADGESSITLNYEGSKLAGASASIDLPVFAGMPMEVGAISLILNFPADLVSIEGVSILDGNNAVGTLAWNVLHDNELRIGWYTGSPMQFATGQQILTLHLRTSAIFSKDQVIRFTVQPNKLNEIGDATFSTIPDALLVTKLVEGSSIGIDTKGMAGLVFECHPNPFETGTTLTYELPFDGKVKIELFNEIGERIRTLTETAETSGKHSLSLDGFGLSAGLYSARLRYEVGDKVIFRTVKMIRRH